MSKLQLIKRVVKGGYVKADTLGNGNWEIGRITKADNTWVWFESAVDGEEIRISRTEAYKASEKEYKTALAARPVNAAEEADANEEWEQQGLTDMIEEDVEGLEEEAKAARSVVKKSYKERYLKAKAASGKATQICGDGLSQILVGKTLEEVYEFAADEMGIDLDDLHAKYEHLNPGQQRMVLGNRLRGFYRKNGKEELAKK